MPRLFWKLFFALWLSIMTFAVLVSWINQTVIQQHQLEESGRGSDINLARFQQRLIRDLLEGGEQKLKQSLRNLPRGLRDHVFILDEDGHEILGRDRMINMRRHRRVKEATAQMKSAEGKTYTLLSTNRPPPRVLLEPGPRGVGLRLGVAGVISALISLILARYLAAPLGQLSRASRQLATGDLSVRVGAPLDERKDEFGQLALDLDEMARRIQESQQANRRLLRDVSHELRSPLARLRVALEIARNKDQSLVVEELNRIELESERLEKLVDEVLSLLRESSGQLELKIQRFNLAELIQDLVATVNYEISDETEKITLASPAVLGLEADRDLLWRVFENLLRNALIHGGGLVKISAMPLSGDEITISVEDSGPGIDERHLARIFEPFYRIDEARTRSDGSRSAGHGLGLAIAASAIRRHAGSISAHNRDAGGLEIRVVLPTRKSGT